MSSPKVALPPHPRRMPPIYTLPIQRLKEITSHVAPGAVLRSMKELKSPQLPRLFILKMIDNHPLLLSITPRLSVRLMRHEASIMASEASLVHFLTGTTTKRSISPVSPRSAEGRSRPEPVALLELVPKLLKHVSSTRETPYPYSVFEYIDGVPISSLSYPLGPSGRRSVDNQIGSLARELASRTSPSGTFGMANRVLPDPSSKVQASTAPKLQGSETWSEAFRTLLEAVLRDGEDMSVLLPYEAIRAHYRRLSWRLDAVTSPRLAVINISQDTNVMVERTNLKDGLDTPMEEVTLTGLRNWSQGVFGDPLISGCFDSPSQDFLEGWVEGGEEVIEDEENKGSRMLLYQCYRAVVAIVTEYYRPQSDSSKRELDGRRKLTSALKVLNGLFNDEDEALKRVRSMSVDLVSAAKRQKLDDNENERSAAY
ncbi:hypothetical protein WAI453_006676 [Rhynchosporium graminicola]|uniref:Aminoglycoside phosphotransferase domain-containing protein n=1 Tax=Rhynchosporium graminicola TaxID=2792576 RepID=A0A1E1K3E8_9HELO|nr:uncharacterized protein RCO7_01851 [Rhynchosporium commune]